MELMVSLPENLHDMLTFHCQSVGNKGTMASPRQGFSAHKGSCLKKTQFFELSKCR